MITLHLTEREFDDIINAIYLSISDLRLDISQTDCIHETKHLKRDIEQKRKLLTKLQKGFKHETIKTS